MIAPTVTVAQLAPVVERALDKRREQDDPPCVIVTARPDTTLELDGVAGEPTRVLASRSPLEIRAALAEHARDGNGVLVVVTDLDAATLGDDLLARVVNRRPFTVDLWLTVCQLFGAGRPSVALAQRPHLAEVLIESRPLEGYPKVVSKVLDVETAVASLLRVRLSLGFDDPATRLVELAADPAAAALVRNASRELHADIVEHLTDRYGPVAAAVVALVSAGKGTDVVAWGLAAGAIHHPDATGTDAARALLDREAGRPGLVPEAWQRLGQLAEDVYRASLDDDARARWRATAETVLDDLNARPCARWSDVIPAAFDQRLDTAAEALSRWRQHPDDIDLANRVHQSINACKQHLERTRQPAPIVTCEMLARIIRRRSATLNTAGTLERVATAYRDDGSWLDRARTVVSRGATHPGLAELCRSVTADADRARVDQARELGTMLAKAALPLPDDLTGVEAVLDDVIAPLASQRAVLLVVLDGMSLPTFHEFAAELTAANWNVVAAGPRTHSPAVAALPTVTEVSRTSLLAGTIRTGSGDSEKRAFAAHPALLRECRAGKPPVLFHKRDLRVGGLDALPEGTLDAIADTTQRVVGVVVNNIDERLKDVVVPTHGWSLAELDPLRELLDTARRAGRAVVLTADHGHVLDRDAEQRPAGGGGERWRPAVENDLAADEIAARGPRVGAGDGAVVVPVIEQVRYSTRRNGYHGGLTPQELFVPLVVLSSDDLHGWQPVSLAAPTWWHHHTAPPAPVSPPPPRRLPGTDAPTLFDTVDAQPADEPSPRAGAVPDLVARLLGSDRFAEQLNNPRVRVDIDQLTPVIGRLADSTPVPEAELSALTGLAAARVGRFVTQLQEVLNVEGYPVVRADAGEVRLDVALLARQFDL